MNGPFVVAQAGSSSSSAASPVQIIKIVKPPAGQTDIFHASFTGLVKIDFTAIANEKITFFRDNRDQSLHVIFTDGSQAIIEPFFDSMGVLSNLLIEVGPNQDLNGTQFAAQFPITTDQAVLPAAGNNGQASGGDFHDAVVDPLLLGNPLDLLPPEELPPVEFHFTLPAQLAENLIPTVFGHVTGIVEEEQLNHGEQPPPNSEAGVGNEDINDVDGNDTDDLPPDNVTQTFSGTLAGLVTGGDLPITFLPNAGANLTTVHDSNGNDVTSIGETVKYFIISPTEIDGVTLGELSRTVFKLFINPDGTFTFILNDQIDHPSHSHDDGSTPQGALEETLNLDLSQAIFAHDATPDPITFPNHTFEIGVIDDTPVVLQSASYDVTVDEDDISTPLSQGTHTHDGAADGSTTGNPDGASGPAFVTGSLAGLVSVGADAVDADNHGTFSFNPDNFQASLAELGFIGLKSHGDLLSYHVDNGAGFQTLVAEAGEDRTVFTLKLFSDGTFEFSLFDQMDHDPPHDVDPAGFISHDPPFPPGLPGDTATADQNTDLIDNDDPDGEPRILDIDQLHFGGLIQFSDYDGDTVELGAAFTIAIRDDIPVLTQGSGTFLTVDEDDISTLGSAPDVGSLGTSPDDGNGDGSFTGNPADVSGGPAFVSGTLGGIVVTPGADEDLTFSFTGNAVNYFVGLGLESHGGDLSFDVDGSILYAFVQNGGGIGTNYDAGIDRLVFTFEITNTTTGDFEFKLYDQLDHDPPPSGTDADQNFGLVDSIPGQLTFIDFGHALQATDFDGDSVVLEDKVQIQIRDDVPVLTQSASVNAIVDEDDIDTSQSKGTSVDDGTADGSSTGPNPPENGDSPGFDGPATVSGTLTGLVQSGADEPLTFSFITANDARAYLENLGLSSKGELLSYDISNGTIIGFDQVGANNGSGFTDYDPGAGDRQVFALTLNSNGTWTFQLFDQMDHDPPYDINPVGFENGDDPNFPGNTHDPDADQNTDLIDNDDPNGDPRDFDISQINFGHIIKATDFDGDSVTLDHVFTITIRDDIPTVQASATSASVIVDETSGQQNDDTTSGSVSSLFSGVANKGTDPDMTTQYAHGSNAVVSASITIGTDEGGPSAQWSLTINGGDGTFSGLQTTAGKNIYLFEQGGLIVGRYEGGAGADPAESNDVAAFAIAIDDTGHISIAQFVSLLHPNTGSSDENIFIDTNTILATITVTDFDDDVASDSVDISGKIGFSDDGPSVSSNNTVQLEDDDLPGGIDTAGVNDDSAPQNATGTLGHSYGADGPGHISLLTPTLPATGGFSVHSNDGTTLIIQQLQNAIQVDVLKVVLTNTSTGAYQVTQLHAIDHPTLDGVSGDNTENNVQFTLNYSVIDGDGDHVDTGTMVIDVDDDMPNPSFSTTSATVIHDETSGVDGDANDVASDLSSLFTLVTNKGNDPDVNNALDPAIGYAQSSGALVSVVPNYGADGPGSITYALDTPGTNALSGLQTTEGLNIRLFEVNSTLVVGRFEVGGNNDPDGSADEQAAFAISIDPTTGVITVVQYVSLKHDDRGDNDEANDNGNNANDALPDDPLTVQQMITDASLRVTVTVTDHDGDSVSSNAVNVGNKIIFQDDGPTVTDVANTQFTPTLTLALDLDETIQPDGAVKVATTDRYNGAETESNGGTSNGGADDVDPDGVTPFVFNHPVVLTAPTNAQAIGELTTAQAGGLGALFTVTTNFGADGPATSGSRVDTLSLVLSSATVGTSLAVTALQSTALASLSLADRTISLVQVDSTHIEGRIPGANHVLGTGGDDIVAFRITLLNPGSPSTAQIQVDQFLPIDHGGSENPSVFDEQALLTLLGGGTLNLQLVTTITDGDGDPATSSATVNLITSGSSFISFDDDGPTVTDSANAQVSPTLALALDLDETIQPNGAVKVATTDHYNGAETESNGGTSNGGADDVDPDGVTPFVFNHPVVLAAPTNAQAIGELTTSVGSGLGSLFTVATSFGTDGPAAGGGRTDTLSLVLSGATVGTSLVVTALQSTALAGLDVAHRTISLVQVDATHIEGRIPGTDGVLGTGGDDFVAFRITLLNPGSPSTAQIQVDQFLPIDHGGSENPSVFDEQALLTLLGGGTLNLQLTTTLTDGDGDQATSSATVNLISSGSSFISFDDDGPSLTVTTPDSVSNSFFFDGFTVTNTWGPGSGIATGTSGAWTIADAGGGSGAVQLERVADGYLGMHTSTNGFMVDLDASPHDVKVTQVIAGLTNGESYVLSFEAGAPLPGTVPGSSHLQVWFGGVMVYDTAPTGTMQIYTVELFGGSGDASNLLEFRETGTPDNYGTFLANVKINDVIVIDETPGVDADSDDTTAPAVVALFATVSNTGSDPDMASPQFATGNTAAVNVAADFGTDGPAAAPNATVYAVTTTNDIDSGLTTTEGKVIHLFQEGQFVVGRFDSDANGSFDKAAFAITIDPGTGILSIAQYVSLHEPDTSSYDEGIYLNNGTLSVNVTVTDGDGDHASQAADISSSIRFEDDGPSVTSSGSATLYLDESIVLPATTSQEGGIVAPGADDTAQTQQDGIHAIGVTTGNVSGLFFGINGGADGVQSQVYTLLMKADVGNDGPITVSTLNSHFFATQPALGGNPDSDTGDVLPFSPYADAQIYLFQIDAQHIEGHVGNNVAGPLALKIFIDPVTGQVTFEQYLALDHGDDLNNHDSALIGTSFIVEGVHAALTVTDGDGDKATAEVPLSVRIEDDGPVVFGVSPSADGNLIVNGSFEQGHGDIGSPDWNIYSSIPGWTYGADHIPFEVQTGGVGGQAAQQGNTLIELDGDTTGNPAHTPQGTPVAHTDATIQQVIAGTVAGETYQLDFYYAPRPGDGAGNDSGLNVLWNGVVVHSINSTGQPDGWQHITLTVIGTGPNNVLGFQGAGGENELGALIDNVSLHAVVILDDEDTTLSPPSKFRAARATTAMVSSRPARSCSTPAPTA